MPTSVLQWPVSIYLYQVIPPLSWVTFDLGHPPCQVDLSLIFLTYLIRDRVTYTDLVTHIHHVTRKLTGALIFVSRRIPIFVIHVNYDSFRAAAELSEPPKRLNMRYR